MREAFTCKVHWSLTEMCLTCTCCLQMNFKIVWRKTTSPVKCTGHLAASVVSTSHGRTWFTVKLLVRWSLIIVLSVGMLSARIALPLGTLSQEMD